MSEEIKKWLNDEDFILAYRSNFDKANDINEDLKNYIKNLQQENKNLNKYKEIFSELISLSNQELVKRNNDLRNILTEFEKWLENELFNKTQIHFQYSLALRKCLDKLQELKEGNNEKNNK